MPTITWTLSNSEEWSLKTSSGFSSDSIYVSRNGSQIAKLKVTLSRLKGIFTLPIAGVVYYLFYIWDSLGISADQFILCRGLYPVAGWRRGHGTEIYHIHAPSCLMCFKNITHANGSNSKWTCFLCQGKFGATPRWICAPCRFDVCDGCFQTVNVQQSTNVPPPVAALPLPAGSQKQASNDLMKAVKAGSLELTRKALLQGADVNICDSNLSSSLHWAAQSGMNDVVALLLKHGAALNELNQSPGYTPLLYATLEKRADTVDILLQHGANPDIRDKGNDSTALQHAAQSNQLGIVQALLDHGADIDATNKYGRTALNYAAAGGHKELTLYLLRRNADPQMAWESGGISSSEIKGMLLASMEHYRARREAEEARIMDAKRQAEEATMPMPKAAVDEAALLSTRAQTMPIPSAAQPGMRLPVIEVPTVSSRAELSQSSFNEDEAEPSSSIRSEIFTPIPIPSSASDGSLRHEAKAETSAAPIDPGASDSSMPLPQSLVAATIAMHARNADPQSHTSTATTAATKVLTSAPTMASTTIGSPGMIRKPLPPAPKKSDSPQRQSSPSIASLPRYTSPASSPGERKQAPLHSPLRNSNTSEFTVVPYEEFKLVKELGAGAFGEVYEATWLGQRVALKRSTARMSEKVRDSVLKEARIMAELRHPGILALMAVSFDGNVPCLILPLMEGGSLYALLHGKSPMNLPASRVKAISLNVAKALAYLHDMNVIHRDVKSSNILLDGSHGAKLSDFGISKLLSNDGSATVIGTPRWMAPECLSQKYDHKVDVYSFGMVLYELFHRRLPFHDCEHPMMVLQRLAQNLRPALDPLLKASGKQLIEECWQSDPQARPSMSKVVVALEDVQDFYP